MTHPVYFPMAKSVHAMFERFYLKTVHVIERSLNKENNKKFNVRRSVMSVYLLILEPQTIINLVICSLEVAHFQNFSVRVLYLHS